MDDSKPAKTRRGNREGTAPYQVKDGRWRADLMVGTTADGKPRRKPVYGSTPAECRRNLKAEISKLDQGITTSGRAPTLEEWLDHWLENICRPNLRHRTVAKYESNIRNYVRGTRVARVRLDKLDPEHLEQLYAAVRAKGLSKSTVAGLHAALRAALNAAVKRGRIAVSPAGRMDAPKPDAFKPKVLAPQVARQLIQAAHDRPDGARWMVALALGLRQGEALALGWDDIDFGRARIRVVRELYRRPWAHGCADGGGDPVCGRKRGDRCPERTGGGIFTDEPKSEAGSRSMALPAPLAEALRAHKRRQDAERQAFEAQGGQWGFVSANGEAVDLVFPRARGRAADARSDWGAWQAFLADAGLPRFRTHDARHTAATLLLELGVPHRVVMEVMGWSQISMVLRYQHVLDSMKEDVADKVGAALWAPPVPAPEPPAGNVVSLADRRARRSG